MRKLALIGYGSFTREIKPLIKNAHVFAHDKYITNSYIKPLSQLKIDEYKLLLMLADPYERYLQASELQGAKFFKFIDKKARIIDPKTVNIGYGTIICHGSVLTTNINIGIHCHINLNSTIGHDTNFGNFVTIAPGVNISGKCNVGNNINFGTNSSVRQGITICDNVVIGMGSCVVKNITEPGIYAGIPAKKIK